MTRQPPEVPTPASREDVEQAIEALTQPQLVRLAKIAAFRHRSLGTRGVGRNEHDLLSDAIIATLEGRRKWFKANVDFVTFLKGVMRSLASHIRAGKALDAFDEIAPNPVNDEQDTEDFVGQIPTQVPSDPERQFLAGDLDRQIREHFNDDPEALLIYEAFLEKMRPAEIQSCLGLTEKEYNSAAKRLRRAVSTFVGGGAR